MEPGNESATMQDALGTGGGGGGEVEMEQVGLQEEVAAQHAEGEQDAAQEQEVAAGATGEDHSGMDATGADDSMATGGDESIDAGPLLDTSGVMGGDGEDGLGVYAKEAVDMLPQTPGGSEVAQASPQGEAGHDREGGTAGMSRFGRKRNVLNFARMIDPLAGRGQSTEVKEPRQPTTTVHDEMQAAATQAPSPHDPLGSWLCRYRLDILF